MNFYQQPKNRALLALLCCLLWGSAFPCIKIGYEYFNIEGTGSTILFAGYRFFLAGIFTFLVACVMEKKIITMKISSVPWVIRQGVLQTTVQYVFFYIGLSNTMGSKASVINAANTFVSIIFAHFVMKSERLTIRKVAGCIIGFAGVVLVNLSSGGFSGGFSFAGEGMVLICTVAYGISSVLMKQISDRETPMTITAYQMLIGSVLLILIGWSMGGKVHGFTLRSSLLFLYLALLSTVAFLLWGILLKYNSVGSVTIFGMSIPIFGVLLSALLLHEKIFTLNNVAALVCVTIGIYIVNKAPISAENK